MPHSCLLAESNFTELSWNIYYWFKFCVSSHATTDQILSFKAKSVRSMFLCSFLLSLFPSSFILSIPHLSDQTVICADTPPLTQHGLNTKLGLLLSMDFSGFLFPFQIFFPSSRGFMGLSFFITQPEFIHPNVIFNWQAISASSNYALFALFSLDFWVCSCWTV